MLLWLGAAPMAGTIRCTNWIIEDGEYKCNMTKMGLLNPFYDFGSTMPR